MRVPTALVLPAALALAGTLPATPAHAAGCGGGWSLVASCTFTAVAGTQVLLSGTSAGTAGGRYGTNVAVSFSLPGGGTIQTCDGYGAHTAQCASSATVPFTGTYVCRGGGMLTGTYSCTTSGA